MSDKPLPFMGEWMECAICKRKQQSDPTIQSQWTTIDFDGVRYYICPGELPGQEGSASDFRHAYNRIFKKLGIDPRGVQ